MKSHSLRFFVFFCLTFVILQFSLALWDVTTIPSGFLAMPRWMLSYPTGVHYSSVSASVPQQMTYQGKVTNTAGIGITDTLDIAFSLWNADVDGDSLWSETQFAVPIIKGLFDVQLGSVNPIALDFDTTYYLQIIVDGDKLLPRTRLTASPYAFRAKFADSVLVSTNKDTIWSAEADPADTVIIMAQTKIHGELIADSIQAVGDNIVIDDHLDIYGCASFFGGLTDVIYTEGFESGDPPAGWEEVDATGTADLNYVAASQYPTGFFPTEGSVMVEFNSFFCGEENEITLRQTTGFSTTGYTSIKVSVDILHDTGYPSSDDRIELSCSRDGVTWIIADTLHRIDGSTGWKTETIILPESMSVRPTIYLSLKFISGYGNDVYIDNLIVTGVDFHILELARICDGDGYFYGDITANAYYGDGSGLTGVGDNDWIIDGTDMYSAVSGNVGIGFTDSILAKLAVNGYVGIGTKITHDPLLVQGYDSTDGIDDGIFISVQNKNSLDSSFCGIRFKNQNQDTDQYYKAGIFFQRTNSYGRGSLMFATHNNDVPQNVGLDQVRMTITRDGMVGINTRDPSCRLEVAGKTATTNFQMTNGATAGYILKSDVSGNATWVNPATVTTAPDGDWVIAGSNMYSGVSGSVGIGTTSPAPSAALDVSSTSGGFVIPRLTNEQRDAITSPTQSLMIYNLSTNCLQIWEYNSWNDIYCPPWCGVCGETEVVEVTNDSTGETWMDRNLGATRQATAYNDYLAYGALFQWGRLSDGHECINWTGSSSGTPVNDTTHATSSSDNPGHSLFIIGEHWTGDWRVPQNDMLWQGTAGVNNPCPSGYRLPTKTEWDNEWGTWSTGGHLGAFGSTLKLVTTGSRGSESGLLFHAGTWGYYWSSTIGSGYSHMLWFTDLGYVETEATTNRAAGLCVRCIKD